MDILFHFSAWIAVPFWVLMIFFPRSALTPRVVNSPWIALPPAICYLMLGLPHVSELVLFFASPSPDSLALLLSQPWAASMFWAHVGAFDLFVGRWIYFDAKERGISPWLVSPALLISVFFGPIGFLLYSAVRGVLHLSVRGERNSHPPTPR